ncbi:MAG: nickel pincer cofactor biosynthesis protein LarC, partial [Actinomycetota bacterium]
MTLVYFDCFAGAAGDMILGALVDAGAPAQLVQEAIRRLGLADVRLEFVQVSRSGLRATKAVVSAPSQPGTRTLTEITAIIRQAGLDERVTTNALHVFELLARAEARAHGSPPEAVHLHEVGMADSIVDVVGSVVALDHFRPTQVVCSDLPVGEGTARGAHGPVPVPSPATLELLRGIPVRGGGTHETVTPSGAALLAGLSDAFERLPRVILDTVGYGAGDRNTEAPNVLRVMIGRPLAEEPPSTDPRSEPVLVMEANLDDMNPEVLPYALEQLIVAGAQDAWVTPVLMKKGRPG